MDDRQSNDLKTLTGTVVFLLTNIGSKSECVRPFLYINQNEILKTYFKGDNPFENLMLRPYDGKAVEVKGKLKRNQTFVIEQISVVTQEAE